MDPIPTKSLLLEREAELAVLGAAVAGAASGSGSGVFIRGPAGIGKSRLLAEARATAGARGLEVLSARGGVMEREYPFGVVRQLFGRVVAFADRYAVMSAGAGALVAPLFGTGVSAGEAPDASFAILHGLYWGCVNLAEERPLLLSVDDVQWADEPSLRFLDFLARRVDELGLALVVAMRTGTGVSDEGSGVLAELSAGELVSVVEPQPLSEAAVGTLTRARFGGREAPGFVQACHAVTAGNPFFLSELHRVLLADGASGDADDEERVRALAPGAIGPIMLSRLARLGPDAVAIARALAVLGDDAELPDVATLGDLERPVAAAGVSALTAAGIFTSDKVLGFTHPLLRDAVYADLPAAVRGEEHARAARVLAAHGRGPDAVAAQIMQAPSAGDAWVGRQLAAAAQLALARGAPGAAVRVLRRALEEPPEPAERGATLMALGMAEAAVQAPEAIGHLIAARDELPPGAPRAGAALALAGFLGFDGQTLAAHDVATSARAELGPEDRELALFLDCVLVGTASVAHADRELMAARLGEWRTLPGDTPAERAVLANVAFELLKAAEPADALVDIAERAVARGGCSFAAPDGLSPIMLVTVLICCGRLSRAEELTSHLLDEARAAGSALWFTMARANRAPLHWHAGRLADAEADARDALQASGSPYSVFHPLAASYLVLALLERGKIAEAQQIADEFSVPSDREDMGMGALVDTSRGHLALALGAPEDALAHLLRAGRSLDAIGALNPVISPWRTGAALALARLGRREEGAEVLLPALASARKCGAPYALCITLRAAALIEDPVSVPILEEALAIAEQSGLRLEHARILVELGGALRRHGHRREARAPLTRGFELAQQCGAVTLAERAHQDLLATGARPRSTVFSGLDALTATERRVAQMATDGMSNPQIAQALFVTLKTVESHLSHTYRKLDITSRLKLADLFDPASSPM